MSQAELFRSLGAPLNNVRWSWGSVRKADGAVFLRVWQDDTIKIEGKRYVHISNLTTLESDLGGNERMSHLKLLEGGSACYLIMCQAVDTKAVPRQVQSFNKNEVFVGDDVIIHDGCYWIGIKSRQPVKSAMLKGGIVQIANTEMLA